jgi:hypothetical protein
MRRRGRFVMTTSDESMHEAICRVRTKSTCCATQSARRRRRQRYRGGRAIALRFKKISAELVDFTRELIDADEAQAAEHEALSIAEELGKPEPDETIIARKTKGFVSRLAITFSGRPTWP